MLHCSPHSHGLYTQPAKRSCTSVEIIGNILRHVYAWPCMKHVRKAELGIKIFSSKLVGGDFKEYLT
jgi:hypothetical protein